MGQYCGFCGNYLNDGEVCSCPGAQQQRMQAQSQNNGQFNEQNNGAYYDQGNSQANEMQPDQMLQLFLNSAGSFRAGRKRPPETKTAPAQEDAP